MRINSTLRKTDAFEMRNRIAKYPRKLTVPFIQNYETPQLVMITTFPPRQCGIATYAQDLMKALEDKFTDSFDIKICALENGVHHYGDEVQYILETSKKESYSQFVKQINNSNAVNLVVLQHEFGLFRGNENDLLQMIKDLNKDVVIAFHTVLPKPDKATQQQIQELVGVATALIVMTHDAKEILEHDYLIPDDKISVIAHGTHLVEHTDKEVLKQKYGYQGRKVLATFGLLSSGKSIETTLNALPKIIKLHPETLFLILGKTHPTVVAQEGERYRNKLQSIIDNLKLNEHVTFVNEYLPLNVLLEYLQMTDVYLFTSKDPNQAVSGTFSYAMSCGCPIISTPIPHALEVLRKGAGCTIDFENSDQLAEEVISLLHDEKLRKTISLNGLHQMIPTSWENAALAHNKLFLQLTDPNRKVHYKIPKINLNHLQKMTTDFGIIQFSMMNQPDINSGYTLDDNARALLAFCQHYQLKANETDLASIEIYLNFIEYCFQPTIGYFANYVSKEREFTSQNKNCNLEDSFGRAIWALGYLLSLHKILPEAIIKKAETLFHQALIQIQSVYSTRAMAFSIKGIYYANLKTVTKENLYIIEQFANRLVQMYKHESDKNWSWFESYLTYANSALPEAMLFAWRATRKTTYQSIALLSFDFLLSKVFTEDYLQVISNKGWLHNGQEINFNKKGGEQPIDVGYTIMALSEFYDVFKIGEYKHKMFLAFEWFLGRNHLNQIIYNPCTGGSYDGLESSYVNLNQGAESTISYLLARLTVERYLSDNSQLVTLLPRKKDTKQHSLTS